MVTPQSPECYPPSYPSAISPTHHLPPYLAHHPHFIHNSHTAFYPPVTGPGDLPPQFFPQHHLPPTIYGEQGESTIRKSDLSSTVLYLQLVRHCDSLGQGKLMFYCSKPLLPSFTSLTGWLWGKIGERGNYHEYWLRSLCHGRSYIEISQKMAKVGVFFALILERMYSGSLQRSLLVPEGNVGNP